jgi:2-polyprenyl-6-methoxyphenol hydroxylase-like FAD-dependent oxidoreductase
MLVEAIPTQKTTAGNGAASTGCVVVGGGPGGLMLALLLARQGVDVTLLEAHKDFDRDFRGDTVHPSTLEILDQIGLAEPLHQLRHSKIYAGPSIPAGNGRFSPIDFGRLNTRFPYVMLVPQVQFLDFLAAEAQKYPTFHMVMGARMESLIEEGGIVRGVRYQKDGVMHEVRALLTVGADGRFSKVRQMAGIEPIKTAPPMDILWFRLPHLPTDQHERALGGGFAKGRMLAIFDRPDYWQIGYVFPKGQYAALREAGLESFRQELAGIEPRFTEHVNALTDWQQFSLLSVESSRCARWYRPGLLLIGDAAHVMSPIGGVGINYAVQDAVVAANLLTDKLRAGHVTLADLQNVQESREFPTKAVQWVQTQMQQRVIVAAFESQKPMRVPSIVRWIFKLPIIRALPARVMAFGVKHVRLDRSLVKPRPAPRAAA